MTTTTVPTIPTARLIAGLRKPAAYPHAVSTPIEIRETHISWVFLSGDWAYKVKKPVKSSFLDYSTLSRRKHFCEEELRLDRRYAPELYLNVVPITCSDDLIHVGGAGNPVEYAVKMRRFPDDALLSTRLSENIFSTEELGRLADSIASFHQQAAVLPKSMQMADPEMVLRDAMDNFADLEELELGDAATATLHVLKDWTSQFFADHQTLMARRVCNGFIRECHGDLHLANVIDWNGKIMPFDGVEFSDHYRWIDVLSDAAFLAMDFAARDHLELSRSFINAYVQKTGDHASLPLLRWYLVFRSLVRAKIDGMKAGQGEGQAAIERCQQQIQLAYRFTLPQQPCLWITHGFSGSGKTTGSEAIIRQHGAFRLRSDLERKRHFGKPPWDQPSAAEKNKLYSAAASAATYGRLRQLAHTILQGGDSVIVDATCLQRDQRDSFHQLAESLGATFAILDFTADIATLRQRVAERLARADDASDADLDVLQSQLLNHDVLGDDEQTFVVRLPDRTTNT